MQVVDLTEENPDLLQWFEDHVFRFFPKSVDVMISGSTVLSKYVQFTEGRQPFPIKDVDVYFKNGEQRTEALQKLRDDFTTVRNHRNSRTLNLAVGSFDLDLIKLCFASPKRLFESFDFTVVCAAVAREDGELKFVADRSFAGDVRHRLLRLHNAFSFDKVHQKSSEAEKIRITYAIFKRFLKYSSRGFKASDSSLTRTLTAVQNMQELSWNAKNVSKVSGSRNI
jgi:hypothetical protein